MVRARKTDLGSHLKKSYFKEFKGKNEHALQDHILNMHPAHLAFLDEVVNKASAGKQLDPFFYPTIDISPYAQIAKKLKGHTHSKIALAKRHREIKGSGFGSIMNATAKGAKAVGKVAWKGMQVVGKAGLKIAGKSAKWLIEHPGQAAQMGQAAVGLASNLMADDEPQYEQQAPRRSRRQPTTSQTAALDELLDTSGSEDEKFPEPPPTKKMSKREMNRIQARGGSMQVKISKNRWVI